MRLHVSVTNGDLSFVAQPLLIGHYRALKLTGAEKVMNVLTGRSMERSLAAGLYPSDLGTPQVFLNTHRDAENPWRLPRPKAVIVVGLGAEGELKASGLARAVCQAVIAWVQHLSEQPVETGADRGDVAVAATLIGSGGTGITAGQSAQSVVQGVRLANERIRQLPKALKASRNDDESAWPEVTHLNLIELYLDRATEAWRALRLQEEHDPEAFTLEDTVLSGQGSLRRPPDSGYRGADYDFISALTDPGSPNQASLSYALDTRRARTEVRAQATQAALIRQLVTGAADADSRDRKIGQTLFKLLIPVELEPFFSDTSAMVLEVDSGTAGIPWELLNSRRGDETGKPWAMRSKMLRKLRTRIFSTDRGDENLEPTFLVIGEPACDPARFQRLPGAAAEARAVCRTLEDAGVDAEHIASLISPDDPTLFGPDAKQVMNALMDANWRVVHISGHGEPPEGDDPKGVALSDTLHLGSREIKSMRMAPELVFVNCCFLSAKDPTQLLMNDQQASSEPHSRPVFAATVAEALIERGVRCVVAAGWAVDDDAAATFSQTFYERLAAGARFIDAVSAAREAAYVAADNGERNNTWAAYQCYGDPDWVLFRNAADGGGAALMQPKDEFANLSSILGLTTTLETIAVESKFQRKDPKRQRARVQYLERTFGERWGSRGEVAQAFGLARSEIGDRSEARDWYQRASEATDGAASFKATEQLANLKSRVAWERVSQATSDRKRRKAVEAGRQEIGDATLLLEKLIALARTSERESVYASAYKRLAMIERMAGRPREEAKAIADMRKHYAIAEELDAAGRAADVFYPAMNRLVADLAMGITGQTLKHFTADLARVRAAVNSKAAGDPDFWSIAAQTELKMYEAISARTLGAARSTIEAEFALLFERVSADRMWASVYDNATFILPIYAAAASRSDRAAANALLESLGKLARPRSTSGHSGGSVKKQVGKRATSKSALDFVRSVKIPAARRSRAAGDATTAADVVFDKAKNEAAVVGSDVISFVQGVTPERRQAIINSSLLAQLAAKTQVPDAEQIKAWYDAYFDVLTNIGWVIQDRGMAEYRETSKNFDAHKAILSVATALMGAAPAALALVKTTLDALTSMNEDSPWITVFDRETRQSKTARFQIGLAEQDASGQFFVTTMAFALEARTQLTQVLFFKAKSSDVTLRHYSGKVTIDTSVLDSVQADIAAKLAGHASAFVKKLPDFK